MTKCASCAGDKVHWMEAIENGYIFISAAKEEIVIGIEISGEESIFFKIQSREERSELKTNPLRGSVHKTLNIVQCPYRYKKQKVIVSLVRMSDIGRSLFVSRDSKVYLTTLPPLMG